MNVIWENGQYGSIVWKQDKSFGTHFGTDFTNPDFVKLAEGFGMPAWRCDSADEFGERLRHALGLDVPSLIVLPIDYSIDVQSALRGGARNGDRCHEHSHRGTDSRRRVEKSSSGGSGATPRGGRLSRFSTPPPRSRSARLRTPRPRTPWPRSTRRWRCARSGPVRPERPSVDPVARIRADDRAAPTSWGC